MTRWIPFEIEKPNSCSFDYHTISAHGIEQRLRWDGYRWCEWVKPTEGEPYTTSVYYPVTFWRYMAPEERK